MQAEREIEGLQRILGKYHRPFVSYLRAHDLPDEIYGLAKKLSALEPEQRMDAIKNIAWEAIPPSGATPIETDRIANIVFFEIQKLIEKKGATDSAVLGNLVKNYASDDLPEMS